MTLDITPSLARAAVTRAARGKPETLTSYAPQHVMHAMNPEFGGTGLTDNLEPHDKQLFIELSTFAARSFHLSLTPRSI
jgi:hypothetical protein